MPLPPVGLQQHAAGGGGGGGFHDPGDIFSSFFGGFGFGGFGGGQQEEQGPPKGEDVQVELDVALEDLYVGREYKVLRRKMVLKPAPGKRKCRCRQKLTTRQLGPGMFQQFTTQECDECPNQKYVPEDETLTVHVEPGMRNGQEINFFEEASGAPMAWLWPRLRQQLLHAGRAHDRRRGRGPQVRDPAGPPQGVLEASVPVRACFPYRPEEHGMTCRRALSHRSGHDLYCNFTIPLVEALTGFKRPLKHLDGHEVSVESSAITRPGETKLIKGASFAGCSCIGILRLCRALAPWLRR